MDLVEFSNLSIMTLSPEHWHSSATHEQYGCLCSTVIHCCTLKVVFSSGAPCSKWLALLGTYPAVKVISSILNSHSFASILAFRSEVEGLRCFRLFGDSICSLVVVDLGSTSFKISLLNYVCCCLNSIVTLSCWFSSTSSCSELSTECTLNSSCLLHFERSLLEADIVGQDPEALVLKSLQDKVPSSAHLKDWTKALWKDCWS